MRSAFWPTLSTLSGIMLSSCTVSTAEVEQNLTEAPEQLAETENRVSANAPAAPGIFGGCQTGFYLYEPEAKLVGRGDNLQRQDWPSTQYRFTFELKKGNSWELMTTDPNSPATLYSGTVQAAGRGLATALLFNGVYVHVFRCDGDVLEFIDVLRGERRDLEASMRQIENYDSDVGSDIPVLRLSKSFGNLRDLARAKTL